MKPLYHVLKSGHYSSLEWMSSFKSKEDVYKEIGYYFDKLYAQNPQFENTCAIRMSLALLNANVHFNGRLLVKDGRFKGRFVEMGAIRLADELRRPHLFGKPQVFLDGAKALNDIGTQHGVIFFHTIPNYGGGHIDLYEPTGICNSGCYFNARETWFWPLH
ncbi:MAG: type VI secretion system amidase effector protein Tae4 [Betaproteobacteria bacterium]|jgi:hypothetical protein|nr:type VI secretion system amidase effector protein Tae4 [Betaproteobacteria bacterium]